MSWTGRRGGATGVPDVLGSGRSRICVGCVDTTVTATAAGRTDGTVASGMRPGVASALLICCGTVMADAATKTTPAVTPRQRASTEQPCRCHPCRSAGTPTSQPRARERSCCLARVSRILACPTDSASSPNVSMKPLTAAAALVSPMSVSSSWSSRKSGLRAPGGSENSTSTAFRKADRISQAASAPNGTASSGGSRQRLTFDDVPAALFALWKATWRRK
jgi:hypothetical protein